MHVARKPGSKSRTTDSDSMAFNWNASSKPGSPRDAPSPPRSSENTWPSHPWRRRFIPSRSGGSISASTYVQLDLLSPLPSVTKRTEHGTPWREPPMEVGPWETRPSSAPVFFKRSRNRPTRRIANTTTVTMTTPMAKSMP